MDYSLAFKAFFGITPESIREEVILTNIRPVFSAIIESALSAERHQKGFYETADICMGNNRHYHVIRINSGSGVIDVVKLLVIFVKRLFLLGIAGCLDSSRSLGEVCVPSEFVSLDSLNECKEMAICQTSGLIHTDDFYRNLQKKGVSLVDMECYDVYRLCKDHLVPLKYIVQISDFPLETPFYSVNPQPIRIERMIDLLQDE